MKDLELWTNMGGGQYSDPLAVAELAVQGEAEGWDGCTVVDSQCISVDPYVTLALCAERTRRLKLSTGVSNPLTRHPAVTASAMATLQRASNGRAVLGIGRGDSALAYLGASPMPIGEFEHALSVIQRYLKGEMVDLETAADMLVGAEKGYKNLSIGTAPPGSWLKWLPEDHQKVPLDVAVTGPKAIGIAARVADQVTCVMGADPQRLKWALDTANRVAEEAGRDPAELSFGTWLIVRPHDDINIARQLAEGHVSGMSRFLILNKKVVGPTSDKERATLERVAQSYDMKTHTQGGAQAEALDPAFIDAFAVVGSAAHCVERIQEIASLGIDRIFFSSALPEQAHGPESYALTVNEVLPRLRS